jgi:mRNA interferase MazF
VHRLVAARATRGREIRKTRPCVIVSPNELNARLGTLIVAPLATGSRPYPFRVACRFEGQDGHVVLDHVRTVDRERLGRRLGVLIGTTQAKILGVLQAKFAP